MSDLITELYYVSLEFHFSYKIRSNKIFVHTLTLFGM